MNSSERYFYKCCLPWVIVAVFMLLVALHCRYTMRKAERELADKAKENVEKFYEQKREAAKSQSSDREWRFSTSIGYDPVIVKEITIEAHDYLIAQHGDRGLSITHSASCKKCAGDWRTLPVLPSGEAQRALCTVNEVAKEIPQNAVAFTNVAPRKTIKPHYVIGVPRKPYCLWHNSLLKGGEVYTTVPTDRGDDIMRLGDWKDENGEDVTPVICTKCLDEMEKTTGYTILPYKREEAQWFTVLPYKREEAQKTEN